MECVTDLSDFDVIKAPVRSLRPGIACEQVGLISPFQAEAPFFVSCWRVGYCWLAQRRFFVAFRRRCPSCWPHWLRLFLPLVLAEYFRRGLYVVRDWQRTVSSLLTPIPCVCMQFAP
jgi:hypothetical protein